MDKQGFSPKELIPVCAASSVSTREIDEPMFQMALCRLTLMQCLANHQRAGTGDRQPGEQDHQQPGELSLLQ